MLAVIIILGILLIGVDQLVKYWAVTSLAEKGSIDFLHIGDFDIMHLTYVENDGAIFGSMSGQRWFLIGIPLLIIATGIVILAKMHKRSKLLNTSIFLFITGGIGNLIDRIYHGYVVDMFDIQLFKFAVFNVADIYVTFAMILLVIYGIFIDPKIEKSKKLSENAGSDNE